MIMLEGAKATTETVEALRSGATAMKAIQKATYGLSHPPGTLSRELVHPSWPCRPLHHKKILIVAQICCRNIDDVDKTMDEINEQTENMKQIQEALSTPIGAAADFDDVRSLPVVLMCFVSRTLVVPRFS